MRQFRIRPAFRLGQNFLIDPAVAGRISAATGLAETDQVIEIGSGLGALTRLLAVQAGRVIAIEIDCQLIPALTQVLSGRSNCIISHQDARQTSFTHLAAQWPGPTIVAGNLPYYITTPLLEKVLCDLPDARRFVFMLQKEAADRLLAPAGSKAYGPTAILLALHGPVSRLMCVPAAAFWPRPQIESVVLVIDKRSDANNIIPAVTRSDGAAAEDASACDEASQAVAADPQERRRLLAFLTICFRQRRKKLSNNLPGVPGLSAADMLTRCNLPPNIRPEQVEPARYLQLYALSGSFHLQTRQGN